MYSKGMSLLIYSGLLYLIGIAVILALKPELMFSKDGSWKEFGLGRAKGKYTWMPFWLFAIMWAMMSYLIVLVVASHTGLSGVRHQADLVVPQTVVEPDQVSMKAMKPPSMPKPKSSLDMKNGYYILDTNETMKRGVPKYIYLGPEAPNVVYHDLHEVESD